MKYNIKKLAFDFPITRIKFSPDDKILAIACQDMIYIWDMEKQGYKHLFRCSSNVSSIEFSKDIKLLASGSIDGKIYIWELATDTLQKVLNLCQGGIWEICFSPDGKKIIYSDAEIDENNAKIASCENNIWIWDLMQNKCIKKFTKHHNGESIRRIAFFSERNIVAVAYGSLRYKSIVLWNINTEERLFTLQHQPDYTWVQGISFNGEGTKLAAGYSYGGHGGIRIWDISDTPGNEKCLAFFDEEESIVQISFSKNGLYIASTGGYHYNYIQVWDAIQKKCIAKIHGRKYGTALLVDINSIGDKMASVGYEFKRPLLYACYKILILLFPSIRWFINVIKEIVYFRREFRIKDFKESEIQFKTHCVLKICFLKNR